MRKFVQYSLLAVMAVILPLLTPVVLGCQCSATEIPVCSEYWQAKVVFDALVTDISPPPDAHGFYDENTVVSLSVEHVYRGSIGKTAIDVQGNGAECRVQYQKGKRYLIYAYDYDANDTRIQTSACSRTREVARADEDFAYIRNLSQQAMFLHGKVVDRHDPVEGVRIEAEGNGIKYHALTDAKGHFNFPLIEPGKYIVRAISTEKSSFMTHRRDAKFYENKKRTIIEFEEQVEKNGCVYVEFQLIGEHPGKIDKKK